MAFPPAVTLASTRDPTQAACMGEAIAAEAVDLDVVLAPGVNIKRNPLCGRNLEYFCKDPMLTGVLGGAFGRAVEARASAPRSSTSPRIRTRTSVQGVTASSTSERCVRSTCDSSSAS
jgi:beta-glucosidase-like glycosyl hydrolase